MNILPKKRWHVRTRENIARVRRDEANVAAEEKERERRTQLAEGESRNAALHRKWKSRNDETVEKPKVPQKQQHINLFEDLEDGKIVSNARNKEHDEEVKEEREKYEKQIGYLTYLGQDTVEATGKVSWYNKVPERNVPGSEASSTGQKTNLLGDPLSTIRHYLGFNELKSLGNKRKRDQDESKAEKTKKVKDGDVPEKRAKHKQAKETKKRSKKKKYRHESKKRQRRDSSTTSVSDTSEESADSSNQSNTVTVAKMEQLRAQRLKREEEERKKSEALLARLRGEPDPEANKPAAVPAITQRYSSQFNPHLARQNMS